MARTCTREATVYVWRFLGPKHPGHAAVKLTGLPNGEKVYISWWPRGGAGKSSAHETKGGRAHHTYKRDMYSETGENTRTLLDLDPRLARTNHRQVLVHFEGADGITFGLDLVWMAAWWEIFTAAPGPEPTITLSS